MSSSSGIRGIRRKKSSLSEVKICIIGAPGVGKSGRIVCGFPSLLEMGEFCLFSVDRSIPDQAIHWRI